MKRTGDIELKEEGKGNSTFHDAVSRVVEVYDSYLKNWWGKLHIIGSKLLFEERKEDVSKLKVALERSDYALKSACVKISIKPVDYLGRNELIYSMRYILRRLEAGKLKANFVEEEYQLAIENSERLKMKLEEKEETIRSVQLDNLILRVERDRYKDDYESNVRILEETGNVPNKTIRRIVGQDNEIRRQSIKIAELTLENEHLQEDVTKEQQKVSELKEERSELVKINAENIKVLMEQMDNLRKEMDEWKNNNPAPLAVPTQIPIGDNHAHFFRNQSLGNNPFDGNSINNVCEEGIYYI